MMPPTSGPCTRGDDERYDLEIDFLDAVFGCEKELDCMRLEVGPGPGPGPTPCC